MTGLLLLPCRFILYLLRPHPLHSRRPVLQLAKKCAWVVAHEPCHFLQGPRASPARSLHRFLPITTLRHTIRVLAALVTGPALNPAFKQPTLLDSSSSSLALACASAPCIKAGGRVRRNARALAFAFSFHNRGLRPGLMPQRCMPCHHKAPGVARSGLRPAAPTGARLTPWARAAPS